MNRVQQTSHNSTKGALAGMVIVAILSVVTASVHGRAHNWVGFGFALASAVFIVNGCLSIFLALHLSRQIKELDAHVRANSGLGEHEDVSAPPNPTPESGSRDAGANNGHSLR